MYSAVKNFEQADLWCSILILLTVLDAMLRANNALLLTLPPYTTTGTQRIMHPALRIHDIITEIVHAVGERSALTRPTLNALSRVCKTFAASAIDELWYMQRSLLPLILLLKGGAVHVRDLPEVDDDDDELVDNDGFAHALYLERDLTFQELEILHRYSYKVRELDVEACTPYLIDDTILQLFSESMEPIFPNLRVLGWYARSSRTILSQFEPFYGLILTSGVTRICFKGGMNARCLGLLPRKCPQVIDIIIDEDVEKYYDEDPPPYPYGFSFGWPRWCCQVSTLRNLTLRLFPGAKHNRSLWRQMPQWSLSIHALRVETDDIQRVADFLAGAKLDHLTSLKIKLIRYPLLPRCQQMGDLFDNISKACSNNNLQALTISKTSSLFVEFDSDTNSETVGPGNTDPYVINSSAFQPLLNITSLVKFKITGANDFRWNLDEITILQLCRTWPKLRTFIINPNGSWASTGRLTLITLKSLARVGPNIEEFGINIDATRVPAIHRRVNNIQQRSLQKLRLGNSKVHSSAAKVAGFLSCVFPNLREIDTQASIFETVFP